jgi:DNA-binding response OmpR family regulator
MERLLLVEHNLLFRDGLALLLEWRTGLSSIHARSLAEARDVLEEADQKPACVVVDLDLPEGEGTEVLKELDGLPVLALIRGHSLQRRGEAIELGADEVLSMTGPPEKMAAAVERLIDRRGAPSSSVPPSRPYSAECVELDFSRLAAWQTASLKGSMGTP